MKTTHIHCGYLEFVLTCVSKKSPGMYEGVCMWERKNKLYETTKFKREA